MIIKAPVLGFDYTKLPYQEFANTLPSVQGATLHELGASSDPTKQIYALSKGDLQSKPVIFILGSLHGQHEWRGAYIVREFFRILGDPSLYPKGFNVAKMLSTFSFYGIVCANPYGYENNIRGNANGVDLNRNFSPNWEEFVNDLPNGYYKGTAPFSEAETQIIRDKVLELKPVAFVDLHIYGNSTNFVCVSDTAMFKDLQGSIERVTKVPRLQNYSTVNLPMAHLWARTVDGHRGKKVIGWLFEPGANETDFHKAFIGLNGLFLYIEYIINLYTEDKHRLFDV